MKTRSKSASTLWIKRGVSVVGLLYTFFVCVLSYCSIFYEIIITRRVLFCVLLSLISAAASAVMIFTRKQILTKISGFVLFPAIMPIVILCFGSWELIVPIAACAVIVFFTNGATEGPKILLGTIYLMVYILAALAYFIFTSILASPAVTETIDSGVSPSGKYRYEVIETIDSSNGSTSVILEPNYLDLNYPMIEFKVKGYDHVVCVKRPLTEVEIEWKKDDLYVNGERWFTPKQATIGKWFEKESRNIDLT
ncbi:MAG: hypothetical protein IJN85_01690 [Oscillospiraceae bacterium]|nr:hypothetical protein [Oscillospiraceae bacterium]